MGSLGLQLEGFFLARGIFFGKGFFYSLFSLCVAPHFTNIIVVIVNTVPHCRFDYRFAILK